MKTSLIIGIVVLVLGLVVLSNALYIVDETEQVIITRFGEVQTVRSTPGLNVKAPFVDVTIRLDNRILRIDAPPAALPDQEKQNLIIYSYARYRITDPVQFLRTLQTENNARSRLGDIVTATLRDRVALRDRFEIIGAEPILDEAGNPVVGEEGLPIVEGRDTRTEILVEVRDSVRRRVAEQNFGIEIIDVRIRRADFPESVYASIFTRMRAMRSRIAAQLRSEGEIEVAEIRSEADKQRAIILSEARRAANQVKAEGDVQSIDIFIQALARDPQLTRYKEGLETYKVSRRLAIN